MVEVLVHEGVFRAAYQGGGHAHAVVGAAPVEVDGAVPASEIGLPLYDRRGYALLGEQAADSETSGASPYDEDFKLLLHGGFPFPAPDCDAL